MRNIAAVLSVLFAANAAIAMPSALSMKELEGFSLLAVSAVEKVAEVPVPGSRFGGNERVVVLKDGFVLKTSDYGHISEYGDALLFVRGAETKLVAGISIFSVDVLETRTRPHQAETTCEALIKSNPVKAIELYGHLSFQQFMANVVRGDYDK